jgi:hypothetical protein
VPGAADHRTSENHPHLEELVDAHSAISALLISLLTDTRSSSRQKYRRADGLDNVYVSGRLLLLFILVLLQPLLSPDKLFRMKSQRECGACCVGSAGTTNANNADYSVLGL